MTTPPPLDDVTRALLLSQRTTLLAMLPVVVTRPDLKPSAVMMLCAIEDALGLPRTVVSRREREAAQR